MNLWKNRPSWFKGGIVLSCIFIFLFIIALFIDPTGELCKGHPCFPLWFGVVGPGVAVLALINAGLASIGLTPIGFFGENIIGNIFGGGLAFIISLPVYFGLGALIVIIINWLRRNKSALYGGLVVVGMDLLLELLGFISPSMSEVLYGGRRSFAEVIGNMIIAFIIGVVIGWIVGKIKKK